MNDFLLEIGTEELPARLLEHLSISLTETLKSALHAAQLTFKEAHAFATPRRLAVRIEHLSDTQPPQIIKRRGPSLEKAFDAHGNPTPAGQGFAKSCGVSIDKLTTHTTAQGEWLYFEKEHAGQKTQTLLPSLVEHTIQRLPIAKPMRWGNGTMLFIRPIHWIVLCYGSQCIDASLFGLQTQQKTYGHRFHHPEALFIESPNTYEAQLEQANVIADASKRKHSIQSQLAALAKQHQLQMKEDPELLSEVTGLVEWPHVMLGTFDPRFLDVPKEALISAMKSHQKCFPAWKDNQLFPGFFIISNRKNAPNNDTIVQGNEKVMHARLSDAAFFYNTDRQTPLSHRQEQLKAITFQEKLGSLYDKSERITQLSRTLATSLNEDKLTCQTAAQLAKCDLASEMVMEFPELQGIMGRYYAQNDGESELIAMAIEDHYHPRFSQDTLPRHRIGDIVALADKIDTVVGIFGIGQKPTGEKDPFALRRRTLGILRIIIEKALPLNLETLVTTSIECYAPKLAKETAHQVLTYCKDRFHAHYQEQGVPTDQLQAVLGPTLAQPYDAHLRLTAVQEFLSCKEAKSLIQSNKRVKNILQKNQNDLPSSSHPEKVHFQEKEEHALYNALQDCTPLSNASYTQQLLQLTQLNEPLSDFFEHVMVMHENPTIRQNRLALLQAIRDAFLSVADLAQLTVDAE